MWRQLVESVASDCKFGPPASEAAMAELEAALGVALPAELRALWGEADGIRARYGEGIWSVQEAIKRNREMRETAAFTELYMPFDHLLFFAEPMNGDMFFIPIQADGVIHNPGIFIWDHETDSRKHVSHWFQTFVGDWFGGKPPFGEEDEEDDEEE
jgi:hypothetical protein